MSDLVNRAVANVLRTAMFNALPDDIQQLFPQVNDPLLGEGPNIRVGHISEFGMNPGFPLVSVFSDGALEGLTARKWRHLTVNIDHWTSAAEAGNVDARGIIRTLYEFTSEFLQDRNFSGGGLVIQRCYEIRASDIMFQAPEKLYHIANAYRVEAISNSGAWY